MLFLAIFGKNVEDAFGPLLYLVFYFAAMMTQTAMTLLFGTAQDARVPELGASGGFTFGLLVARLLADAGKSHPEIDCAPTRSPRGILPWRDGRSRLMRRCAPSPHQV